jgi:hypothetical protein
MKLMSEKKKINKELFGSHWLYVVISDSLYLLTVADWFHRQKFDTVKKEGRQVKLEN